MPCHSRNLTVACGAQHGKALLGAALGAHGAQLLAVYEEQAVAAGARQRALHAA